MFLIKTVYQFVKDSFVAPPISIIKNSNIVQKISAYPKTFHLNSFLLLISTSLQNLYHRITRNHLRKRYTLTAIEIITNLTKYELSQEESDLLKAGLYFSIQRDKIQKFKIFTTFEKIHRSFQPFVSATLNPRKIKVR